ncbi:MAG: hypothetical protein DCF19_06360 [Pseudanabaena frigida]|uniref:Uncharacterized protein n=1 Tax=Pseudanabaena frigida TaxID=945775 RepID=A0A2W4WDV2_9CYAN|nr:MAG: hypothetical protein DCF19_06360 [Pseudanabaena frigida]
MIGQSKPKQPEVLQLDDCLDNRLVVIPSAPERLDEMDDATKLLANLPEEYNPSLQKPPKGRRSLLRWSIYSLLGLGIVGLFLPFFLNELTGGCANKARSSEGKTYVGTMNRGQQAFWTENRTFGKSIPVLELGIQEETSNYKYEVQSFNFVSYQYAIPKNDKAKSFVGAVFVLPEHSQEDIQTVNKTQSVKQQLATFTILCESPKTGVKTKLPKPFLNNGKPTCAEGTAFVN